MIEHAPALRRNRLLPAQPLDKPLQLRAHPMRMQRVNGPGLYEAGERLEPVFCVAQRFASMVTVVDTDRGLLRTSAVPLIEDDELVRECLSERRTGCTKGSVR